jgi:glutamate carboxypeptidase
VSASAAAHLPSDATPAMLAAIERWLRTESPTASAEGVNRMMDLVAAEAAEAGIAAERVPGRDGLGDSLGLRAGPEADVPGILLLSHLDTVHPMGTVDRALPVRRDGDRLYGPGVFDMKGGAWLALQAFKQVARAGSARRPMTFLFTSDEEIGSPMTRGLIEEAARHAAYALVTEPARPGGHVVVSRNGVGRFEIANEGRPAHAGTHHREGRSAIREAARQVLAIDAMTDYARGVTTTVGLISGGTAENVVPQHCRLSVDLRVETAADGDELTARIRRLAPRDPEVTVTVRGGMNRPPWEESEGGRRLFEAARAVAADLGRDLQAAPRSGGGSDGNFTAALGTPTLDGLGIAGEGAHTLHEYGLVSSILPQMRLIAGLLERLR